MRTSIIDSEWADVNGRKKMADIELEDVLALIEEAHAAKTAQALRQTMVYGVGTLITSESCAWTEITVDAYKAKAATVTTVDVNDEKIDLPEMVPVFTHYLWQHPVVEHLLNTGEKSAISISELQVQSEFQALELYQIFYKQLSVEDQLSIGYIDSGIVTGLSVNRASWGFADHERHTLTQIANSVFPFYRTLSQLESCDAQPQSLIEASINDLSLHSETLGVTVREAELLMHVAYGLSNKQIAATCSISEGTVRKHLENAFRKLGVTNRVRAIIRAADVIRLAGS